MSKVVVALQLSVALQEKFDKKPAGLIRFCWKMSSYFVLPTKENHDHGEKNSKIISDCSSVPIEDGGDYNEELPDNVQILSTHDLNVFSYTDLECATGKFSNRIIKTQWGTVFKGWVHEKTYSHAKEVVGLAVMKTFYHFPEDDLQLMGEYSHPNLLRPLGYCYYDSSLCLVHELVEKRSLNDCLCKGAGAELPFTMRVKIAIGITRGLAFLQHKKLITKYWILETNDVWLDKDFNAKLVYFDVKMLETRSSVQTRFIGFRRRRCDVVGLGMLLMEMLTGQPTLMEWQMDSLEREHLSSGAAGMSSRVIKNMVDPRMRLKDDQVERARELLSLLLGFTKYSYTLEHALEELEQLYSRMTRRVTNPSASRSLFCL